MRAIRELGEYEIQRKNLSLENPIPILAENPDSNGTYKHVFAVVFEKNNDYWKYQDVQWEEIDNSNSEKYLYKKLSGHNDASITSRLTTYDKTFDKRILRHITDASKNRNLSKNCRAFFKNIYKEILNNKNDIKLKLQHFIKNTPSGENAIITTKFHDHNNTFYNQHIEPIVESFKKVLFENYYYSKTQKVFSIGKDKKCSICGCKKDEVYGFVNTFNFYTVDKPGYIASGFEAESAWQNYPVCLECAIVLKSGRDFLEENLNFSFYGMNYLLIPKFVMKKDFNDTLQVMSAWRSPTYNEKDSQIFTGDEKDLIQHLTKLEESVSVKFLFFEEKNDAYKIVLLTEDIFPSRFSYLLNQKFKLDELDIFKHTKTKESPFGYKFNFGVLNRFYNARTNKTFIEIVDKIFSGSSISYYSILQDIVNEIRKVFPNIKNERDTKLKDTVLQGFMLILYLQNLDLFRENPKGENMSENRMDEHKEEQETGKQFFKKYPDYFTNPAQKAIFLLGVLIKLFTDVQFRLRESKPFLSKLGNLRMDQRSIQRLLTDVKAKMLEYDKDYYRQLQSEIAANFIEAGKNWQMNNDEINFNFVLGMQLADKFKTQGENNE